MDGSHPRQGFLEARCRRRWRPQVRDLLALRAGLSRSRPIRIAPSSTSNGGRAPATSAVTLEPATPRGRGQRPCRVNKAGTGAMLRRSSAVWGEAGYWRHGRQAQSAAGGSGRMAGLARGQPSNFDRCLAGFVEAPDRTAGRRVRGCGRGGALLRLDRRRVALDRRSVGGMVRAAPAEEHVGPLQQGTRCPPRSGRAHGAGGARGCGPGPLQRGVGVAGSHRCPG